MATIQDLKKNNKFKFNDIIYVVKRKFIDDNKPLIAYKEGDHTEERFYHEGLDIEILSPVKNAHQHK